MVETRPPLSEAFQKSHSRADLDRTHLCIPQVITGPKGEFIEMRIAFKTTLFAAASIAWLLTACNKTADNKPNFEAAINSYYQAHPACLWPAAQQFPVQVGHSDPKAAQFDALVDQGLLTRTTSEKKIIIVSKQENNYDVSDKGRGAWTADSTQPGYGNFCYGHRKVSTIDSYTPTNSEPGATTTVQYHYAFADIPAWASAAETQTAYPRVQTDLSATPKAASVRMTNTSSGWQVATADNPADNP
jgi:hypothetical protein